MQQLADAPRGHCSRRSASSSDAGRRNRVLCSPENDVTKENRSMRLLRPLILVLLASGLLTAQNTSNTSSASEDASVATELQALRQALADQQNEITRQQQELEQLRKQDAIR